MTSKWITEPLREVVGYMAKGIPPAYTESEGSTTIRVLNQKCNRDYTISYSESRLHDLSKKSIPQEKYLRDDDILINSTGTGTAGRIAQLHHVPCPTVVDGHMIVIRANEKVLPRYLGYAIKAHQQEILKLDEGSTGQTELNRERLLSGIIVSYPISLDEQMDIANTFSAIDAHIAENKKINHHLEQMAQAIFKNWFIDFEPFRDGEFVDSELGPIPKGWKVDRLGSITDISTGKRPVLKFDHLTVNASVPIIGASGIMAYTNKHLLSNKIIVTGRVGTHGVVQRYHRPIWVSDNAFIITTNFYEYTYQAFKNINYSKLNRGSTQPLITQTDLKNEIIIRPPDKVLIFFEKAICALFAKVDHNNLESEKLSALRDTLLPKLITGEIRVPLEV